MNYAPELIGVGRYSGELGAYLAKTGMEVDVVTTAPHYPGWKVKEPYASFAYVSETVDGAHVLRCPMLMSTEMRGIWRVLAPLSFAAFSAPAALWRILRRRPQTVLAVEPTLLIAPVALLGARLVGARTVLHVQDLEVDAAFAVGHLSAGWLKRLGLWFERMLLHRFDAVITISDEMGARLRAKGVAEDRLAIVRNWVDVRKIVPLAGPNAFRSELGLGDDDHVVLYSGNIGAKQALNIVLEAAETLQDEPRTVFVIAGDGPEKKALQARFGQLKNVRFLPLQPEEKLCELLNLADLHLLPQDRNAADLVLPSKLGGMLASGRDILACADPGTEIYKFLQDVAIIVPSGNSGAMADAIRRHAQADRRPVTQAHAKVALLDASVNLRRFAALLTNGAPCA
jgi:colanic acid biosynthesis glycosyl transferase WcaI